MDPVLDLLALARANEIEFGITMKPGWIPFRFEDIVAYYLKVLRYLEHSALTKPAVFVRFYDALRN